MPRKPGQPRKDPRLPGLPRKHQPPVDVVLRCLRCDEDFPSVNRLTNRICERCVELNHKLSWRDVARPAITPPGVQSSDSYWE